MLNIFKKREENSSDDLIKKWTEYCKELGLTDGQILGLAYMNTAIPTVLSFLNKNDKILTPLSKVVKDLGRVMQFDSNSYYFFREIYFNAIARGAEIDPFQMGNMPAEFLLGENKYLKHAQSSKGMLMNSRLTILLIQQLGDILIRLNIRLEQAFKLGHSHSISYLANDDYGINFAQSVLYANTLPHYIASAIEIIPFPNGTAVKKEFYLLTKMLEPVLNDFIEDLELKEWIWKYHIALFYEDNQGSLEVKSIWNLSDPDFEKNMIREMMNTLPGYYKINTSIGEQSIGIGPFFETWEEFFPLLNSKMKNEFEVNSPLSVFINRGEACNYLAVKFIAIIKTFFEHRPK